MKTIALVVAIVALATLYTASKSGAEGRPSVGCKPGNLREIAPALIDDMGHFLAELKSAVAKDDKQRVARMVHYPLSFATADAEFTVHSQHEFVERYDQILPVKLRDLLQKQETRCISRVGAQGFTIGTGQVWFDKYPDGTIKIFTITAVLYPGE
jgi:hypothetical protein